MTDSWEARMAARAREREVQRDAALRVAASEQAEAAYEQNAQHDWLNGWYRDGVRSVRMGTGVHCVCCGRCMGITCTVMTPDWKPPGPEPAWPFSQADCPICAGLT